MAISGRGDFPISATWWALGGRGRGRGREALTKQLTYANGAPTALAAAYGDYFFGAASGAAVALTLSFSGASSTMALALSMGVARALTLTMAGTSTMALTLTVTPAGTGSPRTPTSFVAYADMVASRDRVLAASVDETIQQHTFTLDKEDLILSEFFPAVATTSGAFVTALKATARVKDYAGSPTLAASWAWTCYAWASAGVTSFEIKLLDNTYGSTSTVTVTTSLTTGLWRAFGTLTPNFANHADALELQVRVSGGAGTVYVGGLAIFAP